MGWRHSKITYVWLALIIATALSWQFGHGMGFGDKYHYGTLAVLVITFIKVRFVYVDFMELGTAPPAGRGQPARRVALRHPVARPVCLRLVPALHVRAAHVGGVRAALGPRRHLSAAPRPLDRRNRAVCERTPCQVRTYRATTTWSMGLLTCRITMHISGPWQVPANFP